MPQFASTSTPNRKLRRSLQFALFIASLLWFTLSEALAGRAARGLTNRFDIEDARPLLSGLFLIFLLLVGFTLLASMSRIGRVTLRSALGLPKRLTSGREWLLGAAIGWGIAVASVLPMALARALHVRFWTDHRAFGLLGWHVAALLFSTLALEVALRGFAFRRLIEAVGAGWATALMAILLGIAHGISPDSTGISILVTMIGSVLLSVAWLRTHGLWLPWGLHFAWSGSLALIFGLPVRGVSTFSSVVQTRAIGSAWLTGDDFGPEGALFTAVVVLVAIVILVKTTDDYAWDYTRPELVAAGYEVNPDSPAEHVAMERDAAARAPSLVQILPTTSEAISVDGYPPPPPRP
ncbi:type II CAAX endopeptidase family protein [Granulicella arctica]|uniref:type II CAAX endopeptidase family protein n=1 Tax=Granulicella arctica TaxID=940613 RepID=UPI0021DFEFA2|nr:type II CAAX endopeptidase family protein [Granulicella arctica]